MLSAPFFRRYRPFFLRGAGQGHIKLAESRTLVLDILPKTSTPVFGIFSY